MILAPQAGAGIFPDPIDDFLGCPPSQREATRLEAFQVDLPLSSRTYKGEDGFSTDQSEFLEQLALVRPRQPLLPAHIAGLLVVPDESLN